MNYLQGIIIIIGLALMLSGMVKFYQGSSFMQRLGFVLNQIILKRRK